MNERNYTLDLGGREFVAKFSDLAMQAGGSVMLSCDSTVVLAVGKMDPKILAVNAASLEIATSPVPFGGPVGCVSISVPKNKVDGQNEESKLLINNYLPTVTDATNDLDLVVCGKENKVCMIEAMAFEIDNDMMGTALNIAMQEINKLENWQKEVIEKENKNSKIEKLVFIKPAVPAELLDLFNEKVLPILKSELFGNKSKIVIADAEKILDEIVEEKYKDNDTARNAIWDHMHEVLDAMFHDGAIVENKRADLRDFDQVRALFAKAGGVSSVLHGTGIFYRGETHVLSVLTLDGPETRLEVEGIEAAGKKRFIHHYNFPPYSVGETGRFGGMNRREMGHGFLAEKALLPVIPNYETFPYTIRVVSESTSSNGSTSQASICAASIAMM